MGKKQISTTELLELMWKVVSEEERQNIIRKYKMDYADINFTPARHRMVTGRAMTLAKTVINDGGTEEEVKKAILNLMVCMDAEKYKLDLKKWEQDSNVALLKQKYH